MNSYDVAVIGAGPGGYVAAIRAAQLGMSVALVEKWPTLGGTCLNIGCIPSKALLESSELLHAARHKLADHGVVCDQVSFDLKKMMERKDKVVGELVGGLPLLMKKNKIAVLTGEGSVSADRTVSVAKADGSREQLKADHVVLALGSVPIELPFLKFDGERVVSSTEALAFQDVPKRLAVVGAGAIGLELGSVWARLGSQVTVIELLPRVAPNSDAEVSKALQRALEKQGLAFRLNCRLSGAEVKNDELVVGFQNEKGDQDELACDKVLVAVGRRPLSDAAWLAEAGVRLDDKKRVRVDDQFRTNVAGIYAIGDLIPGPMLAHKAEEDGVAVAEMLAGMPIHVNYDVVPNIVYTWPELAEVGLSEDEAKKRGIPYRTGKFFFRANGRAKALNETEGFVKIVAHAETDRLLGVHIVGPRASDLIAEAVTAMEFHGSAEDVGRIVHAHPTLSEVVKEAALAVDKRPIHG